MGSGRDRGLFAGPPVRVGVLLSSYCLAIDVMAARHVSPVQKTARSGPSGEFSMSLDSDVIVDRRRIRRKLTFWRVAAIVVAVAAVVGIGGVAIPSQRSPLTA